MRAKAEIDFWFRVLVWGIVLIMLVSIMIVPPNEKIIGYTVGVPMICFILWIYFGTYYEFREQYLYCRSGPFVEKIVYENIESVKLSQNMLSSMALSRKTLKYDSMARVLSQVRHIYHLLTVKNFSWN